MMKTLQGKPMMPGTARGKAVVTRMPMNFTGSFTKPINIVPGKRAVVKDRHHELFNTNLKGVVLVFPACIGSTYTGMILLDLMTHGDAPSAIIVQRADPLLMSGTVLAEVWFGCGIPIVEYASDDLFDAIKTGDIVEINGETGEIKVG